MAARTKDTELPLTWDDAYALEDALDFHAGTCDDVDAVRAVRHLRRMLNVRISAHEEKLL